MANGPPLDVKVWGDFACFTRPEAKVERVSYPIMTPSAARGILEAIFWKPEFSWEVRAIHVLKSISFFSILRNEVNSRASYRAAISWANSGGGFFADEDRAQRHSLCLRDVAYVIKAEQVLRKHVTDDIAKYRDQFRRRVNKGQCYARPYLGCREFAASFSASSDDDVPIPDSGPLGRILFDIDYLSDGSGRGAPRFFEAQLAGGVMKVPFGLYKKEG